MMRIRFRVLKMIVKRQMSILSSWMKEYGLGNVKCRCGYECGGEGGVLYVDFSLAGVMRKYFLLGLGTFTFGSWLGRYDEMRFLKIFEDY
ncbi:hypothetical protein BGAL_0646g00040 [Botrytis galanthina]|uniref:Transmembrane protein n=1 Tax=Botrytis galanthina TaxID=278940 RepID=A0A4S8QMV1_9HELO|nr:hypothetical protein BGAL_0646g00040 [Botrytis galanthina]